MLQTAHKLPTDLSLVQNFGFCRSILPHSHFGQTHSMFPASWRAGKFPFSKTDFGMISVQVQGPCHVRHLSFISSYDARHSSFRRYSNLPRAGVLDISFNVCTAILTSDA